MKWIYHLVLSSVLCHGVSFTYPYDRDGLFLERCVLRYQEICGLFQFEQVMQVI